MELSSEEESDDSLALKAKNVINKQSRKWKVTTNCQMRMNVKVKRKKANLKREFVT